MSGIQRMGRTALILGVILATVLWSVAAAFLFVPKAQAQVAGCVSGSLIKGTLPAVYYCGADGKRYVFTNDKNYFTWYSNFSGVQVVSDSVLAGIQIGGNVTYRPGVKMVKIQSDPKTYAVSRGGVLRHVSSESIAACLWGANWNQQIDDISDAFFVNYQVGFTITSCLDYNRQGEMDSAETVNEDKSLTAPIPPPPAGSPTVTGTSPANAAVNVAAASTVSATFSEAMNASTINTGTFLLMRGSTAVAGTVSYSGNTATFFPNAALEANTTYTATVTTGARDMSGNGLTGNYAWSFSTGGSVSTPSVTSVTPAENATNVAVDANLTATFSEAMDASSISGSTFLLAKGGTSVAGTVSYASNTATFNPTANLEANATYTATVQTGARDVDGNQLVAARVWSFTTGSAAAGAPVVISTEPAANATGVSLGSNVRATFSEPMDASTINTGTFTLSSASGSVAGTVSYSGNVATFNPNSSLTGSATYTATVMTGARDAGGTPIASAHTWTFVTAP